METTYEVLAEGEGKQVGKSDTVTVHATGIVKETGKKFWSTKDAGQQPFTYQAGVNKVIKGWDQGCLGMKVGGVRKLDIPAPEGYGAGTLSHTRLADDCYPHPRHIYSPT
jgi:U3 small nucleolar RNA-associated protein 21